MSSFFRQCFTDTITVVSPLLQEPPIHWPGKLLQVLLHNPTQPNTTLFQQMNPQFCWLSHTSLLLDYHVLPTAKAIHSMHVPNSQHIVFNQLLTPQLHLVIRGTQWTQAFSKPPQTRSPTTLDIMKAILNLLLHKSASYDITTLWAACCM